MEEDIFDNYSKITLPYLPRKIVVSGANGRNGFTTLIELTKLPLEELVAFVRTEEQIDNVKAKLREFTEASESHSQIEPVITNDPRQTAHAQIWINWRGANLATLKKENSNLEKDAQQRGMHLRDMLLEKNLEIAIRDGMYAKKYAPNSIYMQQSNPCDILVRSIHKLGLNTITTGTLMEYYRFTKFFSLNFPEISMERATGLYIGEHGELAVPVKESLSLGGISLESWVESVYGQNGITKLEKIFKDVNNEAVWLRQRLGETPSLGPAAVCRYVVEKLLDPKKGVVLGLGTYVDGPYGLKDTAMSLPVLLNRNGARIVEQKFNDEVMGELKIAASHLQEMNMFADKLAKEKGLYDIKI